MSVALAFGGLAALACLAFGLLLMGWPAPTPRRIAVGGVFVLFGGVGLLLVTDPALAAEGAGPSYAVPIPADLTAALVDVAMLGLSALGAWLIRRAAEWLHVDREGKLVARLEDGMYAALAHARERMIDQGRAVDDVEVRSELVAAAANYLLPKMPQTMRALGVDAMGLHERLAARLDAVAPRSGGPTVLSRGH